MWKLQMFLWWRTLRAYTPEELEKLAKFLPWRCRVCIPLVRLEARMCSSSWPLPAGEDRFLMAAEGFHEDLVVEAGESLHSG